jgi:hypothetical protein
MKSKLESVVDNIRSEISESVSWTGQDIKTIDKIVPAQGNLYQKVEKSRKLADDLVRILPFMSKFTLHLYKADIDDVYKRAENLLKDAEKLNMFSPKDDDGIGSTYFSAKDLTKGFESLIDAYNVILEEMPWTEHEFLKGKYNVEIPQ